MSSPVAGKRVEVVLIYQSLLGLYGDRGNATVLVKRLAWRGYEPVLTVVEPGDPFPDTGHIYLLGGGEDAAQVSAVRALRANGGLHRAVDGGAALLAVCAGYQIVGMSFTVGHQDEVISGLGLLDVTTTRGPVRAVGEIISRWNGGDGQEQWLTGFENHGGYTRLGPGAKPLATVEIGLGNCNDGTEGAVAGTVIGTYPHGPIRLGIPHSPTTSSNWPWGMTCHRWSVPRSTSSGGSGSRGFAGPVRAAVACPECRRDHSIVGVHDS